jgi:hypothetical protein
MKISFPLRCCPVVLIVICFACSYSVADHPDDIYWQKGFTVCGIDERVHALTVYNGQLIAGGVFNVACDTLAHNLAAWDGNSWIPMATNFEQDDGSPRVYALTGYDGKLIVGGFFDSVDGVPANSIAAWNGSEWDSLGAGVTSKVYALTVYDSQLIVGGSFSEAGGLAIEGIASWNGSEWDSLGTGVVAIVRSFAEYDGTLIVGGVTEAGGMSVNRIASWNGSEWDSLGLGMNGLVHALTVYRVYDDQLYAGGEFTSAGGNPASHLAAWDGTSWAPVGGGTDYNVYALSVYDGQLYAMGTFDSAGGMPANYIATWNGKSWTNLGTGLDFCSSNPSALTSYDGKLIAGGHFNHAGDVPAKNIAAWDGSSWSPLGSGWGGRINALMPYFNLLVAGGRFESIGGVAANNIAAWNGSSWINLGSGVNGDVNALTVCNFKLIAGGNFTSAGGVPADYVAAWDYVSWSAVEGGYPPNSEVKALGCYNDKVIAGTLNGGIWAWTDGWPYWELIGVLDPAHNVEEIADFTVYNYNLIAGGSFSEVNTTHAYCIAAWDGSDWLNIGTGSLWTRALGVYDNKLYVGAGFGGWLRCWDGITWTNLSAGWGEINGISAFAVFNNELIVAGGIDPEDGGPGKNIAAWNGFNWAPLGSGLNSHVKALAVYDDKLYAAGYFTIAGGKVSAYFAEWTNSDPVAALAPAKLNTSTFILYQNVPNPFNPSTRIAFTLPRQSHASLSIYNVEGKLVTTLVDDVFDEGDNQVSWNGIDANGNPVSSGVYFYRLKAGGETLTKKMILLK